MGGLGRFARRPLCVAVAGIALVAARATTMAHVGPEELDRETRALVARRPEDPEVHLQRARALRLAQEWEAALAALAAAAARGADRDVVAANRGAILLDAGRPRSALLEFDSLLARRPDAEGVAFDRARAHRALGENEAAARDFARAIGAMRAPRPEHVIAHRDALLALGRRDAAIAALDHGMARIGRIASLQLAAIDLEVEVGRSDAALRRLDELLARRNPNPVWIARRGEILERMGRPAAARAEYARALALIADRAEARRTRAFDALRRRLETALAARSEGGEGR